MNTTIVQKSQSDQDTINLFSLGVLINLRIRQWSGRKMITRSDLIKVGYDPDKLPPDICNLGRKLLVSKSELQAFTQIEQRARKVLERWSVPFNVTSAHFVPTKMLPTVEQQIKELKDEFFKRADSFITRFDDLVGTVKENHHEFWEKCLKGLYPSNPQALRSKFQFDWYTFKIAGIDSIQEIEFDIKTNDSIHSKINEEVGKFVEEYVGAMRGETIRFCDLMTARVSGRPYGDETDSKKLTPKSLSCFRNYLDRFHQMNVFGDREIEKMLSDFKDTFLDSGVAPRDFGSATVKDSITKSLEAIRAKAASEGESGSKFIGELKRKVVL